MDIESEHPLKSKKGMQNTTKKIVCDGISVKKVKSQSIQLSQLQNVIKDNLQNNTQTLLLGGGRTDFFVTEDSRKYITKTQQYKKDCKYNYIDSRGYFDSLHVKYVRVYSAGELQEKQIVSEFRSATDIAESFKTALKLDLSPIRMWQVSLAGAVLFGMVSMSMIYSNLGQSVMAKGSEGPIVIENSETTLMLEDSAEESSETEESDSNIEDEGDKESENEMDSKKQEIEKQQKEEIEVEQKDSKLTQVDSVQKSSSEKQNSTDGESEEKTQEQKSEKQIKTMDGIVQKTDASSNETEEDEVVNTEEEVEMEEYSLEREAQEMVEGYPIEKMLPYILKQDPEVAKYLIAMAKQESQWGKRVPVLNGQDCYNYWGYRSKRKLMGSGGHTCFNSRKDAVETVGKRISDLIYKYDRKTAKDLIVWKCGSSCDGHSQAGVDRWIGTVGSYYDDLSQ